MMGWSCPDRESWRSQWCHGQSHWLRRGRHNGGTGVSLSQHLYESLKKMITPG